MLAPSPHIKQVLGLNLLASLGFETAGDLKHCGFALGTPACSHSPKILFTL